MSSFHSRFQTHLVRCVVLLLVPVPGRMQDTTTPVLSLGDALARASSDNPSLAAYSYTQRAAEGLVEQAGLRPNPTLEFTAENFMGTGRVQGVRGLEATVQASQTFERGDKRGKRLALAGREKESAAKSMRCSARRFSQPRQSRTSR